MPATVEAPNELTERVLLERALKVCMTISGLTNNCHACNLHKGLSAQLAMEIEAFILTKYLGLGDPPPGR